MPRYEFSTAAPPTAFEQLLEQTRTETGLAPPASPPTENDSAELPPLERRTLVLGIVGAAMLLGLLIALIRAAPAAPPRPVAQPTAPAAAPSPAPSLSPVPSPSLPVGLAVYWEPGGALAPSVQAGTVYTPTGRYGADWVELTLDGGGVVWARSDVVPRVDLARLVDRAPPPTATPAPQPLYQAPLPAAPDAPTPDLRPERCVTTIYGSECSRDLNASEEEIAAEIEQRAREHSASWLATATAASR